MQHLSRFVLACLLGMALYVPLVQAVAPGVRTGTLQPLPLGDDDIDPVTAHRVLDLAAPETEWTGEALYLQWLNGDCTILLTQVKPPVYLVTYTLSAGGLGTIVVEDAL